MKRIFDLNGVLFFLAVLASGRLINDKFQHVFVVYSGNTLIYAVIGLLGFMIFAFLGLRPAEVRRDRARWLVVTLTFLTIISLLWLKQIEARRGAETVEGYNDGVVQTMAAANFLLHGVNPYQADYSQTNFRYFYSPLGPNADNVANTHFAYPPLVLLLMTPVAWLHDHVSTWFDPQSLNTLYFFLLAGVLIAMQRTWERRTLLTLLTIGNPILWLYALSGFNDFLFVLALTLVAILLSRGSWWAAGIAFGLALASKQTAWISAPLMLAFLIYSWSRQPADRARLWQFVWWSAGAAVVCYLPFLIWGPRDLWSDIVVYVSGSIPLSFPISGWSLLQYLRVAHLVESPWAIVPSWPFQLLFVVPFLYFAIRYLRRNLQPLTWLFLSTMMILGMTLFNRFGSDNYYVAIGALWLSVYALQDQANTGLDQSHVSSPS